VVTIQVSGTLPLQVETFIQTATGFQVRFNRAIDVNVLNLYGTELGGFGSPDVVVTGLASASTVRGSLVLDADSKGITFIRTGSVLTADTYTVTLRSAANGFKDLAGVLLDGDHNGVAGDDYIKSFNVVPSTVAVVSIPDFARGPGQPVNIPPTGSGIPVTLSDGTGVESVDLVLTYDPTLLTVTAVVFSPTLPVGLLSEVNLTVPGVVRVVIAGALAPGAQTLFSLVATVPNTASYRAKHILHFAQVDINELAAKADDGVHAVAYLGDASGNGTYSALDATRVLRVSAGLDSGFAPFLLLDPVIVGDITANGSFSALDATRILQEIVGLDRPEIPPVPTGFVLPVPIADPLVTIGSIGQEFTGTLGSTVTVPVNIDNADLLETFELRIAYDNTRLDVSTNDVHKGPLTSGGTLMVNVDKAAGLIYVAMLMSPALTAGAGSLLEIDFHVLETAAYGETTLDLQSLSLNEGQLVLTVVPVIGADSTDSILTIAPKVTRQTAPAVTRNTDFTYLGTDLDNFDSELFRKLSRGRRAPRQASALR
jgi:hypothetical protein